MSNHAPDIRVSKIPHYERLRSFLDLIDSQSVNIYRSMITTIESHRGTPQNTTDWSDQEEWIPELLEGQELTLAKHLYHGSDGKLHLRYLRRIDALINTIGNLVTVNGQFKVLEDGLSFVENPLGSVEKEIDYKEGLLHLLIIIAENGPGKRNDFMPHFAEILDMYSPNLKAKTVKTEAWSHRISNLQSRALVDRSGFIYEITQKGLSYIESSNELLSQAGYESSTPEKTSIRRLIQEQKDSVREQMINTLLDMNPFHVEHLIKDLLIAMGYENVGVTKSSHDGGVDVIAEIEVGITSVREVIQVKRYASNIGRTTLDELRGSLHRFDATRGTIITTSDFSSNAKEAAFERGAAPITLIDRERLIDLLIEYEIGCRKRSIQLIEFESTDFSSYDESPD